MTSAKSTASDPKALAGKPQIHDDCMELTVFSCWTAKALLKAKINSVNVDKHGKFITIDVDDDPSAKPFFALEAYDDKAEVDKLEVWCALCQETMTLVKQPGGVKGWYRCEGNKHEVVIAEAESKE